ncbi:MAG: peroxiredoxin [Alphaproteobacteria bacterium HGW-Alphaproteobacteria-1]|jgi:peroxiredoxin/predicted 2-oxoglutarate/Fe(II)-dependent dioxygenase YbiX|nr:MAG: peroxiredoxin [Alphaproteobacteria bacterium HGW-Alphaproteobacteria-1]
MEDTGENYRELQPGDRAPQFRARTRSNPAFRFDSIAGRWIVLAFPGSLAADAVRHQIDTARSATGIFDDKTASLFVVSTDPADESENRITDRIPGCRVFYDHDGRVARLYGALPKDGGGADSLRRMWFVVDPSLTLRRVVPMSEDGTCLDGVLVFLRTAPPPAHFLGFELPPPVLVLPYVFEPDFCDHLITQYKAHGGEASGFMRDEKGKTVAVLDPGFKVRRDYVISDPALISATQARILRKVVPQISRVHYFQCTRMERYIVGCYPADEGGHFRPHRDNTTIGTAHRRFAVSINLNDDFEGGEVSFPEYSQRGIKAPKGAAVIFSCSLLHAVAKVTSGTRYAFLPFLYDDAAAKLRERNAARVPNSAGYRA